MTTEFQASSPAGLPTDGLWAATGIHATLLNFYEDHANSSGLIPKPSVDPITLKDVLPYLILSKRTESGDWQFTVVGTEIVAGYGRDFSGVLLSQLEYSPCQNVYRQMIQECTKTREPLLSVGRMHYPERQVLDTQKTILPISDNGSSVSHCLFGLSVVQRPRSIDYFYQPIKPLGSVDCLFQITERAFTEGADSRFVSYIRRIESDRKGTDNTMVS